MPEIGNCPICPKGSRPVVLIGGVCHHHYKNPGDKVERTDVRELQKVAKENKLTLKAWYDMQLKSLPKKCECCGGKLTKPADLPDKTFIAHILDKRPAAFPSVATHPNNRFYACFTCHSEYDSKTWPEKSMMDIAITCKERVATFYHLLTDKEKGKLPVWIKPENE